MCRFRHVRDVYLRCNHAINRPVEMVTCDSPNCKFSPSHPVNCVPPRCLRTCAQYRGYPQQYSPNIDNFCPSCWKVMGSRRRY
ncbi:hypothetical protein C8J56DRAFT_1061855 [Mycena floridula]|nr:hypothetical protein C8J56DRAFT_1061855 [Mycena floridula]